jgi:uncharacterized protein (TIGR02611 family)
MKALAKRVLIGVIGGAVTVIGLVFLIAPGPGWLIIFAGLGILATEFAWASMVLERVKESASKAASKTGLKKEHREILLATFFAFSLVLLVIWYIYIR